MKSSIQHTSSHPQITKLIGYINSGDFGEVLNSQPLKSTAQQISRDERYIQGYAAIKSGMFCLGLRIWGPLLAKGPATLVEDARNLAILLLDKSLFPDFKLEADVDYLKDIYVTLRNLAADHPSYTSIRETLLFRLWDINTKNSHLAINQILSSPKEKVGTCLKFRLLRTQVNATLSGETNQRISYKDLYKAALIFAYLGEVNGLINNSDKDADIITKALKLRFANQLSDVNELQHKRLDHEIRTLLDLRYNQSPATEWDTLVQRMGSPDAGPIGAIWDSIKPLRILEKFTKTSGFRLEGIPEDHPLLDRLLVAAVEESDNKILAMICSLIGKSPNTHYLGMVEAVETLFHKGYDEFVKSCPAFENLITNALAKHPDNVAFHNIATPVKMGALRLNLPNWRTEAEWLVQFGPQCVSERAKDLLTMDDESVDFLRVVLKKATQKSFAVDAYTNGHLKLALGFRKSFPHNRLWSRTRPKTMHLKLATFCYGLMKNFDDLQKSIQYESPFFNIEVFLAFHPPELATYAQAIVTILLDKLRPFEDLELHDVWDLSKVLDPTPPIAQKWVSEKTSPETLLGVTFGAKKEEILKATMKKISLEPRRAVEFRHAQGLLFDPAYRLNLIWDNNPLIQDYSANQNDTSELKEPGRKNNFDPMSIAFRIAEKV